MSGGASVDGAGVAGMVSTLQSLLHECTDSGDGKRLRALWFTLLGSWSWSATTCCSLP